MKTNVKVTVINDLSSKEIDLENIIVFCVNIHADPTKSHDCTTLIDDASTRMVRVEKTPNSPTKIYALSHDGRPELAIWYPVTVSKVNNHE